MNPEHGIEEVLKMQDFKGASQEERKQVREELQALLKADPVLAQGKYGLPTQRLIRALADPGLDKETGGGPVTNLLKYFSAELGVCMKRDYAGDCLTYLADIVIHGGMDNQLEPVRFAQIRVVLNHLLSTLVSRGTNLESLFALYNDGLLSAGRTFARRWEFVSQILAGDNAREFHVVIALDNVTSPDDFPPYIGGIQFARAPQLSPSPGNHYRTRHVQNYLSEGRSRLFASARVNAYDARAAGEQVLNQLTRVVNLIRFEYEAARVSIREAFAYQVGVEAVRTLQFPSQIPNPSTSVDSAGVQAFVAAVDELVPHDHFKQDGLDRVHSAFRLYRTGLDTSVLDNKLTNWWTALEYLVRGSTSDNAIGQSVERLVAPVLGVAYFPKHLLAHRNVLVELCPRLIDPNTKEPLELRGMNLLKLYETLIREEVQALLLPALTQHPYIEEHVAYFLKMLRTPTMLYGQAMLHDKRVRWHIQRLWRTRCDIVHSAAKQKSLLLLCSNLEYYLKTTLMALLNEVRSLPTLSGPKEFFERRQYAHTELLEDLRADRDLVLRRLLST